MQEENLLFFFIWMLYFLQLHKSSYNFPNISFYINAYAKSCHDFDNVTFMWMRLYESFCYFANISARREDFNYFVCEKKKAIIKKTSINISNMICL